SLPVISFWVADGIATSHGTSHTQPPGTNVTWSPRRSAYALTRPRSTTLICLSRSRSMPFSSTTYHEESEQATTTPPSCSTFSMVWMATLPEPDTTTRLP